MGNSPSTSLPPLEVVDSCDTTRFMGTWFVIAVKPTMFETSNSNAVEKYTWVSSSNKSHDIDVDFSYMSTEDPNDSKAKLQSVPQKGYIQGQDKSNSGLWKVSPFWPIKVKYLILEVDTENYDYAIIGYPTRQYCWILSRSPQMKDEDYQRLTTCLTDKHKYDLSAKPALRKVPQQWTAEMRTRRGLTSKDIPDSMLTDHYNQE
jgi:apolipoprotein D and lipocalin family protein